MIAATPPAPRRAKGPSPTSVRRPNGVQQATTTDSRGAAHPLPHRAKFPTPTRARRLNGVHPAAPADSRRAARPLPHHTTFPTPTRARRLNGVHPATTTDIGPAARPVRCRAIAPVGTFREAVTAALPAPCRVPAPVGKFREAAIPAQPPHFFARPALRRVTCPSPTPMCSPPDTRPAVTTPTRLPRRATAPVREYHAAPALRVRPGRIATAFHLGKNTSAGGPGQPARGGIGR